MVLKRLAISSERVIIPCIRCKENVHINITRKEYEQYKRSRERVSDLFPHLNASEKEMLISQYCDKCWDFLFKEEE